MPLYQYQCRECGHNLEARQKFSDESLSECPNCGAPQGLFRVVQAAGIVFKGSGFYVTDSRGNRDNLTGSTKRSTDSSSSNDSSSGSNGSSESKPESKPKESANTAVPSAD